MAIYNTLGTLDEFIADQIPTDFLSTDLFSSFDSIHVVDYQHNSLGNNYVLSIVLAIPEVIAFKLFGLDSVIFSVGESGSEYTIVNLTYFHGSEPRLLISDLKFSLTFEQGYLKPLKKVGDIYELSNDEALSISTQGGVSIDANFDIDFEGFEGIELTPFQIGETGIKVIPGEIKFDFSRTSSIPEVRDAGFEEGFVGIYISEIELILPNDLPDIVPNKLTGEHWLIGSGGVSGSINLSFENDDVEEEKTLFGLPFTPLSIGLDIDRNRIKEFSISGQLDLSYFDGPINVELNIDGSGEYFLSILPDSNGAGGDALFVLEKDQIMRLSITHFALMNTGGVHKLMFSGDMLPKLLDLEWPIIHLDDVGFDSKGRITLGNSWVKLPETYSIDYKGFGIELTEIGFGESANREWVGFSGGVQISGDIPIKGGVEGFKVSWPASAEDFSIDKISVSMQGVYIDVTVPDTLRFYGKVELVDDDNGSEFRGGVKLELYFANLSFDAQFIAGKNTDGQQRFYLAVDLDLPFGIPLGTLPLSIYGFSGLYANNMLPDKAEDERWIDKREIKNFYYKDPEDGLINEGKWAYADGGKGFGAGLTLGTAFDDGYALNAKALLLVLIPGPIIIVEGRANILSKRSDGDSYAGSMLAIFDNRAGTFLMNVQLEFLVPRSGWLFELSGGAEAFFNFNNPSKWHIYLGQKTPEERRIVAKLLNIVRATSYFMLDNSGIFMGGNTGFDKKWKFSALSVRLYAEMGVDLGLTWQPVNTMGEVELEGGVKLKAFGMGLGLDMAAMIAASAPNPYHLEGKFSVKLNLPWPLPDPSATVKLVWKEEQPKPDFPKVLSKVSMEHLKIDNTWELTRGTPTENVPVDGCIHITFDKPVIDETSEGISTFNIDNVKLENEDADSVYTFDYSLKDVKIEKKNAQTGRWENIHDLDENEYIQLFGSWQKMPGVRGNTKLMLNSISPFSGMRRLIEDNISIPAVVDQDKDDSIYSDPNRKVCIDFEDKREGQIFEGFIRYDEITFTANQSIKIVNLEHNRVANKGIRLESLKHDERKLAEEQLKRLGHGLNELTLHLNKSFQYIDLLISKDSEISLEVTFLNGEVQRRNIRIENYDPITFRAEQVSKIKIKGNDFVLLDVCMSNKYSSENETQGGYSEYGGYARPGNVDDEILHKFTGLFDPDAEYKIHINTRVVRKKSGVYDDEKTFPDIYFFNTGFAPGIHVQQDSEEQIINGTLFDLSPYVVDTYPSVKAPNEVQMPVYCGNDIRVTLSTGTGPVSAMYEMNHADLQIVLTDSSGKSPLDANNEPIHYMLKWMNSPTPIILRETEQWLYVTMGRDSERERVRPLFDKGEVLVAGANASSLQPQSHYQADINGFISTGAALNPTILRKKYSIYNMSFSTSRYVNFTHHMHSFTNNVWEYNIPNESEQAMRVVSDISYLMPHYESKIEHHFEDYNAEEDAKLFETIAEKLDLNSRGVPEVLEISTISHDGVPYGLLLESPEAIDWKRVNISLYYRDNLTNREPNFTRFEILDAKSYQGHDYVGNHLDLRLREYVDLLLKKDIDLSHHRLSVMSESTEEKIFFNFPDNFKCQAGTILRLTNLPDSNRAYSPDIKEIYTDNANDEMNLFGDQIQLGLFDPEGKLLYEKIVDHSPYSRRKLNIVRSKDSSKAILWGIKPEHEPDSLDPVYNSETNEIGTIDEGGISAGEYRLQCTWYRNTGMADVPVITRFHDDTAEDVSLEFRLAENLEGRV